MPCCKYYGSNILASVLTDYTCSLISLSQKLHDTLSEKDLTTMAYYRVAYILNDIRKPVAPDMRASVV